MKPCREIIVPRVRIACPYCGSEHRRKSDGSRLLADGDTLRYERCATCGRKYHVRVTEQFGNLPLNGNTRCGARIGSKQ